MAKIVRLTMAQALVKFLAAQRIPADDGRPTPLFAGVFAIFGHGNVAGLGEALYAMRERLPTWRAHNEQGMAHAAIAFAKAHQRRRLIACTSSIGPGAANMVTAAALAHANRLPVLLLPGDTFASRRPDPVLQQLEHAHDPGLSTNDCFRPVSRYFDRITRPEQIIQSLPTAVHTLLDPEHCGPATLALCQDVQAEAFDYPLDFFRETTHHIAARPPDTRQLQQVAELIPTARKPLLIAGGGVHYAGAFASLARLAKERAIPIAETQAGKGSVAWDHSHYAGAIGVTGSDAANRLAAEADLIIAVGTRLQDFTTGSRTLFEAAQLIQINVGGFDAIKHGAVALVADADRALKALEPLLGDWRADAHWLQRAQDLSRQWNRYYDAVTAIDAAPDAGPPSDAQVLGAVKRRSAPGDVVVCAAGGLPGELHKLWRCDHPRGYQVEYGYSCMGYEIAGGLGVKMALPEREVFVLVGDGSYLMLNSELATSVMLGHKIIVVLLDNRGYGCIDRLQRATGGASFNNLLRDCVQADDGAPAIDFAAHAQALGARAEQVADLKELEDAIARARAADTSYLIAIATDPDQSSDGGHWWDVAVAEVSERDAVRQARSEYAQQTRAQPY